MLSIGLIPIHDLDYQGLDSCFLICTPFTELLPPKFAIFTICNAPITIDLQFDVRGMESLLTFQLAHWPYQFVFRRSLGLNDSRNWLSLFISCLLASLTASAESAMSKYLKQTKFILTGANISKFGASFIHSANIPAKRLCSRSFCWIPFIP